MTGPASEAGRQTRTARLRWLDPAWRLEVDGWVEAQLGGLGRRVSGPIDQPHLRPWSTALSIPTDEGIVWFKAGGPGNAYEAALVERLSRWAAPRVLSPLAVDVDRGWLLLPDGGRRLRETLDGGPGLEPWTRILGAWADLQRQLAPRAAKLLAAGVPDLLELSDVMDQPRLFSTFMLLDAGTAVRKPAGGRRPPQAQAVLLLR